MGFIKSLFYFVIFISMFFTNDTDESASAARSNLIGDNWPYFLAVFGFILFILLIILPLFLPEIESYYINKKLKPGFQIKNNLFKLVWIYFISIAIYKWYYIYHSDDDSPTITFNFIVVFVKIVFLILMVSVLSDEYVADYLGLDTTYTSFTTSVEQSVVQAYAQSVVQGVQQDSNSESLHLTGPE